MRQLTPLMALSVCVALCLPSVAQSQTPPPGNPLPAVFALAEPAVVRVHTREGRGSGFLVDANHVVTAWHVVQGRQDLVVETADGQLLPATLETRSVQDDLAVLRLEGPVSNLAAAVQPLVLAPTTPAVGTRVAHLGHPLAPAREPKRELSMGPHPWSLTEGIVSQVGQSTLQSNAAVDCGSSGGPLLDMEGRVVGVVTLRLGTLGGATRVERLAALLADEPMLPKGPSLDLAGRYGLGGARIVAGSADSSNFLTLSSGLDLIIDRRFAIGLDVQADLLVGKARKEAGLRSTRFMIGTRLGPRIEAPFRAKRHLPFAIQPYFAAGLSISRQGTHTKSLQFTDPQCDASLEECAYRTTDATVWDPIRMAPYVGGGLQIDFGAAYLDVGITTNPTAPVRDTRLQFGVGVRF
ncbi:MAG: trypsin-like peptidase domain-containing protein [Deltaproteobacteria bacterium]|nr:trypsin-like peptidase domain-containing protein [Deltaproteobacteria bacterium]